MASRRPHSRGGRHGRGSDSGSGARARAGRPLAGLAALLALVAAVLCLAAPRGALAQFDDTSSFNFNAPSASSAANIRNALQPVVLAGNIQLISTGAPPVTWSLQKSADQSSVRVQAGTGATAPVNYLVRVVAAGPVNQNSLPFQVTGNIVITNPNNALSVRFRQVTAQLVMFAGSAAASSSWASSFAGGLRSSFPAVCGSFTIPPNGRMICTFSAPVAIAGTGQVTPVATFTDDYIVQAAGGTGNVQGIPVPISVPGNLGAQPCATVSDAFGGARAPTQVTGNRPQGTSTCDTQAFSYQAVFGPYKTTECGSFTVTNTATIAPTGGSAASGPQQQSASVNVEVFGCDAPAAAAAPPPPPPPPPPAQPPGGPTTTTFADQQPLFAQPYASLSGVQGQFTGGAAAAAPGPAAGWTLTATQDPPTRLVLRANGADTAAVTFTVAASTNAAAAAPAAAAPSATARAFVTGTVTLINPVGQPFAVQLVAVEVGSGAIMVGTGAAACPAQVLPAATAASPGTLACTFAVPVSGAGGGVVTARVLLPQLPQAIVTAPQPFSFAGAAPVAAAPAAAGGGAATARATVDSTFAPAGFAYAPMSIAGSGTRPATATEGGTFLTGPQTWTWALTLGPFPAGGAFCGKNTVNTVARVFPLLPGGQGQVDPSQEVAQAGTSLVVRVDCAGQTGATATEEYVPTGERRRRRIA